MCCERHEKPTEEERLESIRAARARVLRLSQGFDSTGVYADEVYAEVLRRQGEAMYAAFRQYEQARAERQRLEQLRAQANTIRLLRQVEAVVEAVDPSPTFREQIVSASLRKLVEEANRPAPADFKLDGVPFTLSEPTRADWAEAASVRADEILAQVEREAVPV